MVPQIICSEVLPSDKEESLFACGALPRSLVERVRVVPEFFGSLTLTLAEPGT